MGRTMDSLFGRSFKPYKFRALLNLAISRLAVLKHQRQSRCSLARSDVVQLLQLDQHDRALIRVEQVIKEQNMLDVLAMIDGYCNIVIERMHLIEQERECPEELKAAVAELSYASSRCGDFPELQEIRAVFISRFGKEVVASAIELRNNSGVTTKMIQKLSTRQPSLEIRMEMLKKIAAENNITLQFGEVSEEALDVNTKQNQLKSDLSTNSVPVTRPVLSEEVMTDDEFTDSMRAKKKYKDVADAAQAAFMSAAYAAEAARAAVELSRSQPFDPDGPNSPGTSRGKSSDIQEKVGSEVECKETQDEESMTKNTTTVEKMIGSKSAKDVVEMSTMSDAVDDAKQFEKELVIDESDMGDEKKSIGIWQNTDLGVDVQPSLHREVTETENLYTAGNEVSERIGMSDAVDHHAKQFEESVIDKSNIGDEHKDIGISHNTDLGVDVQPSLHTEVMETENLHTAGNEVSESIGTKIKAGLKWLKPGNHSAEAERYKMQNPKKFNEKGHFPFRTKQVRGC